jgi:hypothetical protein
VTKKILMNNPDASSPRHWDTLLESIDLAIAQFSIICHVRLLDPGVAERVIDGDEQVCSGEHATAFVKLRALLIMHFTVRQQMNHELGETESASIAAHIREHLRPRVGSQLGGPDPAA